jgi:hypothetical protein
MLVQNLHRTKHLYFPPTALREYCAVSDSEQPRLDRQARIRAYNLEYYHQHKHHRKESQREYGRSYKMQNINKMRDSHRDYYQQNKDNRKESNRDYIHGYYVKNINKNSGSQREYYHHYYHENKKLDKISEQNRDYSQRNKEKMRETIREYHHRDSDIKSLRKSRNYWNTPELVREYFESIKGQLLIANHTDWHRISRAQIMKMGGMFLHYADFTI